MWESCPTRVVGKMPGGRRSHVSRGGVYQQPEMMAGGGGKATRGHVSSGRAAQGDQIINSTELLVTSRDNLWCLAQ